MKGLLKWPLVIAAIVVVLRVVLEQIGAPDAVSNFASVTALVLLIGPIYFAIRIAESGQPRPYRTLLKTNAIYTAIVRVMTFPTYWLAYIYQWPQFRFSINAGGVVGEGVTPMQAFVLTPIVAALLWVIGSVVIGGVIGSIVIAMKRKRKPVTA